MSTTREVRRTAKAVAPGYPLTRKFAVGAAIIIVLTALFVVQIHKQRSMGRIDKIKTGCMRTIRSRAVLVLNVEATGQSAWLAEEQVRATITVDISDGDSLVAIEAHPQ